MSFDMISLFWKNKMVKYMKFTYDISDYLGRK